MNFLDIASGIGQATGPAVQNVGVLSNIANDQARTEIARQSAIDTQANEQARIGIAQEGMGIEKSRLALTQDEAIRSKAAFDLEQAARVRANAEAVRQTTPSIKVEDFINAIPGVKGENSRNYAAGVVKTFDPEGSDQGMLTPQRAQQIRDFLKDPENQGVMAGHALRDVRANLHITQADIHAVTDPTAIDNAIAKETEKLRKALPTATPVELKQAAQKNVFEMKKKEMDQLRSQQAQYDQQEKELGYVFNSIQKEREARAKVAEIDNITKLAVAQAGGDVQAAWDALTKHEEKLKQIEHQGKAGEHLKLPPEIAKIEIERIHSMAGALAMKEYNRITTELGTADNPGTLSPEGRAEKLAKDPLYQRVDSLERIKRMYPADWFKQIQDQSFVMMILPAKDRKNYNDAINNVIQRSTPGGIPTVPVPGSPSTASPTTPVVNIVAPTDYTPESLSKFLKQPGLTEGHIATVKAGISPENQAAVDRAVMAYNKTEKAGKTTGAVPTQSGQPTKETTAPSTGIPKGPKTEVISATLTNGKTLTQSFAPTVADRIATLLSDINRAYKTGKLTPVQRDQEVTNIFNKFTVKQEKSCLILKK